MKKFKRIISILLVVIVLVSLNLTCITVSAATVNKQLAVTVFKQANSYYCGPATVKEVLNYMLGTSKTQDQYASDLGTTTDGTTMTNIPDVLNKYQSSCYYIYTEISSMSEWSSDVSFDINLNHPVVIDIKSTTSNWPYATSGHYMCISGYDNSGSTAYAWVADPHPTYYGTYKYTAEKVYTVNMAHFRHAIVW